MQLNQRTLIRTVVNKVDWSFVHGQRIGYNRELASSVGEFADEVGHRVDERRNRFDTGLKMQWLKYLWTVSKVLASILYRRAFVLDGLSD